MNSRTREFIISELKRLSEVGGCSTKYWKELEAEFNTFAMKLPR
jgi:hypothetical protein